MSVRGKKITKLAKEIATHSWHIFADDNTEFEWCSECGTVLWGGEMIYPHHAYPCNI